MGGVRGSEAGKGKCANCAKCAKVCTPPLAHLIIRTYGKATAETRRAPRTQRRVQGSGFRVQHKTTSYQLSAVSAGPRARTGDGRAQGQVKYSSGTGRRPGRGGRLAAAVGDCCGVADSGGKKGRGIEGPRGRGAAGRMAGATDSCEVAGRDSRTRISAVRHRVRRNGGAATRRCRVYRGGRGPGA